MRGAHARARALRPGNGRLRAAVGRAAVRRCLRAARGRGRALTWGWVRGTGCAGPGVRGASGRGSAWLLVHGLLDPEDLGRGRAAAAWPGGGTL